MSETILELQDVTRVYRISQGVFRRAATLTAVRASISTPVWPTSLQVAVMCTALFLASVSSSTFTDDNASGWQSGMRSDVRFAAWMPATCAMARTSPFLCARLMTSGDERTINQLWKVGSRKRHVVKDGEDLVRRQTRQLG